MRQPVLSANTITFPVERRTPLLFFNCFPAVGKPELGTRVRVIGDKVQNSTTRDAAICDSKGFQVHLVAGSLIIEAKVESSSSNLSDNQFQPTPP